MKTKLIILFITFYGHAYAQGSWAQKANFGGTGRAGAVGFSIGTKGYIGTGTEGSGSSGPNKNDFWEWDQLTDTWTQMADFAGTARSYAIGFSIGNKGYIGTGYDGTNKKNDFWEWNQSNNTWLQKANFGGTARYCSVGFSINSKGYIGTGYDDNSSTKKDFWEWDQASDTWTQKASLGGSVRGEAIGFSIGSKGYIATGNDSSALLKKDFWEWDQASDTWTQKADFGGTARRNALGFSIGTKGYIGTGYDGGSSKKDIWEWDQTNNIWSQKANFGGTSRSQAVSFSIGTLGYIGTGMDGINNRQDFWEFNPAATGINEVKLDNLISVYPNPASDFATITINNGCNANIILTIYSVKGELIRTETLQGNQKQINVKDLSKGIYFIEIKSKDWVGKQKMIIQR